MDCLILHDSGNEPEPPAQPPPKPQAQPPPKPRIDPMAAPALAPALGLRQDSSTPVQPPHEQSFVAISPDPNKPCASAGNNNVSKKRSRDDNVARPVCIPIKKKKVKVEVEEYVCPWCNKYFSHTWDLQVHDRYAH